MSGSSLHVKYRPKTFDDVYGHESIVASLKRVVKDGRAHSFIFTGPAGVGKTTLARILANELAGGEATSANIEPIDAATHTGVEAVREIAAKAHYRAIGGSSVKALIVDEAHRLSGSAWDALLAITEEPPKHVYWMFCSTNPSKIPKTIQTRCLTYDLKLLKDDDIAILLLYVIDQEKLDVNDEIFEAIVEASSGSPRQALVFLEACIYCESAAEARKVMRTAGQSKEVVDLCRFLIKGRGQSWTEAMRYVKGLAEGTDAESVRIVVVNYFAVALKGAKNDKEALRLLSILECFATPYQQSDKDGPLLLSLGQAIGIGQ